MALNEQLKAVLVCPRCKGQLTFREERQEIHCAACKLVYAIEDDIPAMLPDEAKPLQG